MSLPKKQRSNTHLYQTEDVPQGSRSFFSRLTSRFRSKKRPSLSIDPAATAPPAQHAVPGSASSPNVIHSPTIFALVDATASLSTTSLPCMLASRAPTESRVECEARDPSVHRVRADSSGSTPRSMSRGRQARGTPGDDEYAPNSPTLRTLPPSPLVSAFPPTTDVEDGKTEGETKETDGASTSQSPTMQSGTPLPQTPLHIHTSPSLVFSDSDDGTTQSVLSPLTPLAGNTASDFTSGRSGSQSTHTTRDSLPPVDIVLSDALKDEQCITAELLSPTQPEKAPPTLVVSIPTETASEKVDGAMGSSVSPIRARSLVVVEEDEEEGAEGAKEQQQASPGAAGLGVRLQTQENAERTRKLSETSVNGEFVTPKRAAPVKRSSTFAMLTRGPSMLFGRREKLATQPVRPTTFYATSTPTQDTLAPATTTRKASLMKTNQIRRALPVRAQTVHSVMSNVEIGKQMDGFLNTKSSLESQGVDASKVAPAAKTMIVTSPIIDQETQHLTEVAFF
ncbi:hypothetical protein FRB96_005027 [Tulasnella sp. 330]|nr:hypothetical protein FRB96_005027 [Tulasnella sp. 330]